MAKTFWTKDMSTGVRLNNNMLREDKSDKTISTTIYNAKDFRADEGETREDRGVKPPTSGIVYHDTHIRKSGSDPDGNRIQFALLGGEQANRSDNVIPSR
ncbi:hypothetical protein PR048_020094 [Dryococelus australis]|uniref:Uncharacterized protein n=1 Tax=Dryococelus australis TaxID=614101 RepID=A0ABQ9H5J5_9NEOP|nr:hypothetical protein PR048_020094 [Dryococelus australis]